MPQRYNKYKIKAILLFLNYYYLFICNAIYLLFNTFKARGR